MCPVATSALYALELWFRTWSVRTHLGQISSDTFPIFEFFFAVFTGFGFLCTHRGAAEILRYRDESTKTANSPDKPSPFQNTLPWLHQGEGGCVCSPTQSAQEAACASAEWAGGGGCETAMQWWCRCEAGAVEGAAVEVLL